MSEAFWPATAPTPSGWAGLIRQSWQRCRSQLALRPEMQRQPCFVGAEDLRRRRRQMGPLFEIAALEMQALHHGIGAPAGLSLTDAEGVILYYHGTPSFTREAERAGMREGAIWTEAELGTNGIGTCLAAHAPVLVRHEEHYLRQNAAFVCCAAPIRDGRGEMVAVLNLSYGQSGDSAPTLAMVTQVARAIETFALLESAREQYAIRLHAHPALVTSGSGAVIVVDREGAIQGLNQAAREWFGPKASALIDRPATSLGLGLDLARLDEASRRSPWQAQRLGEDELFVLLIPPASTAAIAASDVLVQAERQALLGVVEACGWNISRAARTLGMDRKTLHRKLQRHGLTRPVLNT